MPFYTYILYSASSDKYYIGQIEDLENRLYSHNNSHSRVTKFVHDWQLVYKEEFSTRSEAIKEKLK